MNPHAKIVVLEKGPAVSFANCGLPYHLGGEIAKREKLLVASPELFKRRFGVEVRTGQEVTRIDRVQKQVEVKPTDGSAGYIEAYDRLILAPGAEPIVPAWALPTDENVSALWTLRDMDRLLERLREKATRKVMVVGAGFVGLEVVEQLVRDGREVTVIQQSPQVLPIMDPEMSWPLVAAMREQGVQVHLGVTIAKVKRTENCVTQVELTDGSVLDTDLIVSSIGVRPRVELAQAAGLKIGSMGGITVDALMRTSDPDILAVGDAVEYYHGVMEQPMRVPLAGPANRAGRVAGTVAAGGKAQPMPSVFGTAIVRVFERTAAMTGLSSQALTRQKIEHRSVIIEAAHHASYYPNAKPLTIKLIYTPNEGRILGAQVIGTEGVDKRIDVIATAMYFKGTVADLAGVDLAYAPPFASAKDPVHMAAFVALNDLHDQPTIMAYDASLDGYQVVDVREPAEIERQPLVGAINIPVDQLRTRWMELDPKKPTVTICQSGKRAHVAACFLHGQGVAGVKNLTGG